MSLVGRWLGILFGKECGLVQNKPRGVGQCHVASKVLWFRECGCTGIEIEVVQGCRCSMGQALVLRCFDSVF